MKNLIYISFLIISLNTFAQKINGKVFNTDKVPLAGASIYLDGTTIATISDENGNFALNYDPKANNILVISFMGYQNAYFKGFDFKNDLNVYLNVEKNTLDEVVVVGKKELFTREQKLKIFKEYLIGSTTNSAAVVIQNEEDVHFKYDKEKHILKAFLDKPLIIINPYLGYRISYDLQAFEVTFGKVSINASDVVKNYYAGLSHFEEISNSDEILARREEAYQGSQIHFFRNLANNIWGKDQFLLSKNDSNIFPNSCFKVSKEGFSTKVEVISQPKGTESKNFVASYDVLYNKKEQSSIVFETTTFYIYKYGNNSNIGNIIFSGKIAEERMGEMLPLNYGIKENLL